MGVLFLECCNNLFKYTLGPYLHTEERNTSKPRLLQFDRQPMSSSLSCHPKLYETGRFAHNKRYAKTCLVCAAPQYYYTSCQAFVFIYMCTKHNKCTQLSSRPTLTCSPCLSLTMQIRPEAAINTNIKKMVRPHIYHLMYNGQHNIASLAMIGTSKLARRKDGTEATRPSEG